MSSKSKNSSSQELEEIDIESNKKKRRNSVDMTEGPFLKKMILFAIPIILSGLLQSFYNAADLIVVNFFTEGDTAVGAIGCTSAITNLVLGLVMGLSVGAGVLVAHYVGAKRFEDVRRVVHTSVLVSVIFGAIIAIVGIFISEPLLVLMDTSPAVLHYAALYMRIIFLGAPASLLYNYIASMMRSAGDSKRPLIFLAISGLINVALYSFAVCVGNNGDRVSYAHRRRDENSSEGAQDRLEEIQKDALYRNPLGNSRLALLAFEHSYSSRDEFH